MGYTGSDQPIQRYYVQFRKAKDFRKFKQVDLAQETPVKAPPRRPPTASQVAHWITFKEDQRLEWQKRYLTQLCEADQEIREANELILECTTILRERKGELFDAWLEKVEQQGISELRNFAQSLKKDYAAVKAGLVARTSRGADHAPKIAEKTDVRARSLRATSLARPAQSLIQAPYKVRVSHFYFTQNIPRQK